MDQQELDDAYDQVVYAPNRDQVGKRRVANSDRARSVIGAPARVAYGPTEIEKLDIYRSKQANAHGNAPVNIFIHGGAWRANKAADYAFLAEPFVQAGPTTSSSTSPTSTRPRAICFMVEQVRRASLAHNNARSFGGDPNRLYLTSHSSGSHIGGCVVTHDGQGEPPVDILGRR
jgi:arylformamidase